MFFGVVHACSLSGTCALRFYAKAPSKEPCDSGFIRDVDGST